MLCSQFGFKATVQPRIVPVAPKPGLMRSSLLPPAEFQGRRAPVGAARARMSGISGPLVAPGLIVWRDRFG